MVLEENVFKVPVFKRKGNNSNGSQAKKGAASGPSEWQQEEQSESESSMKGC